MLIVFVLYQHGISEPSKFKMLDLPDRLSFVGAVSNLERMGAVENGCVSTLGRKMLDYSIPPFAAYCLSRKFNGDPRDRQDLITLIAILCSDNFLIGGATSDLADIRKRYQVIGSDHLSKLTLFYKFVEAKSKKEFCRHAGIRRKIAEQVLLLREQLSLVDLKASNKDLPKSQPLTLESAINGVIPHFSFNREKLLTHWKESFFTRTAVLVGTSEYKIENCGSRAWVHPDSVIFLEKSKPRKVIFNTIVRTKKLYMRDISSID